MRSFAHARYGCVRVFFDLASSAARQILQGGIQFPAPTRTAGSVHPAKLTTLHVQPHLRFLMPSPFRSCLSRHIIALIAMIVFVLPATGAPDQVALFTAANADWNAQGGLHGHGHDHEDDARESASVGGQETKQGHGHNHADHSHDAAGLVPSFANSLTFTQRSWRSHREWLSVSHSPFLLERPPRPLVV